MAVQDLSNPTDEQIGEYWRTYTDVVQAHRNGYHKPYSNIHDDAGLGHAYSLGFSDALVRLAERVPA